MDTALEALERAYPFRVQCYAICRGSGGAGRFCGGDAIYCEVERLHDAPVTILSEHLRCSPHGLVGGSRAGRGALF